MPSNTGLARRFDPRCFKWESRRGITYSAPIHQMNVKKVVDQIFWKRFADELHSDPAAHSGLKLRRRNPSPGANGANRQEAAATSRFPRGRRDRRHTCRRGAGAGLWRAHAVRMHGALHMQSPKSIIPIAGSLVILALFVVLAVLATIAKLVQVGQSFGGASSRTGSRAS